MGLTREQKRISCYDDTMYFIKHGHIEIKHLLAGVEASFKVEAGVIQTAFINEDGDWIDDARHDPTDFQHYPTAYIRAATDDEIQFFQELKRLNTTYLSMYLKDDGSERIHSG